MELHEKRNNASITQPMHPKSIEYGRVELVKDMLCELNMAKACECSLGDDTAIAGVSISIFSIGALRITIGLTKTAWIN